MTDSTFSCRIGCGACCIAPSINTAFFGMPSGKRAGERCVHLDGDNRCALFGEPQRPQFCVDLRPEPSMCGATNDEAFAILERLEHATKPRR
ncbi:MAG: YkgJ family cysteine cluster protein [Planctomycetes bacterium]|nr:YkgJ family cysteine cluster protein [Planctomycetota bacterium]